MRIPFSNGFQVNININYTYGTLQGDKIHQTVQKIIFIGKSGGYYNKYNPLCLESMRSNDVLFA